MMKCNDFKNSLTDVFDNSPDTLLVIEMQEHMKNCPFCTNEYTQTKEVFEKLKPSISFGSFNSGLKQNILTQIKKEEFNMETTNKKNINLKKWHKRAMAVAASIVFIVAVFIMSERSPFVNRAQAAESIMLRSITAMDALKSMFITMEVRSLPGEGFDFIGQEYEFIEYKFWKQFSGLQPWRIEKPGRTVVFDGHDQFLFLPKTSYAITTNKNPRFVDWMNIFFEPRMILENEIAFTKAHKAVYKINKTNDEIILSINANALGNFRNNYLKNSSILESDNSRVYVFDRASMVLKSFELYLNAGGKSTNVIKIKSIAYNIPIQASIFSIQLPANVQWHPYIMDDYVKAFTNIDSKEAAKRFFKALEDEDFNAISPVWSVLQITDKEKLNEICSIYGGLQVVNLGDPFKSGLYPGEFVPFEIKLKSGDIEKFYLALRNDNPHNTWKVDGGL